MALSLGMRVGHEVYILADKTYKVILQEVHSNVLVTIRVEVLGESEAVEYTLTDTKMQEVLKDVYVWVGAASRGSLTRLLFDAPKDIKILRSNVYKGVMKN